MSSADAVHNDPAAGVWTTVVTCEPRVRSFVHRLTTDVDEANDVVQMVMLRLYSKIGRYREGNLDGWLYRVTRNVFLDHRLRKGRLREHPDRPRDRPGHPDEVTAEVERRELLRVVGAALIELPALLREPIFLRGIEGLSYREIADRLDVSPGTVRSRIYRGRERLRARLKAYLAA